MKKLVSVACLVLLTACSGGGGSGVEINAEPDRPVLPEVDVAAVQQLRGYLNGVAIGAAAALPAGDGPIMAAMNSSGYGGGSPFRVGGHAALQCSGEGDARRCQLAPGQAFDNVRVYHKALSEAEIQALSQR
ncbi:hypothetical protein [Bacterioplanoides pacificum]|uniref:Lipoprotein n=1 Tax=Bacterioplanoides pacificum TaxID=1171596 RepID=A0ABV7VWV5_9GAMM